MQWLLVLKGIGVCIGLLGLMGVGAWLQSLLLTDAEQQDYADHMDRFLYGDD